jgi:hypothetical protein
MAGVLQGISCHLSPNINAGTVNAINTAGEGEVVAEAGEGIHMDYTLLPHTDLTVRTNPTAELSSIFGSVSLLSF